jgi:hypothetical protein
MMMLLKRRRIHFSLRALLLFLTSCGILCGWFWRANIYPEQRRKVAVAYFRELNVDLRYGAGNRSPIRSPGSYFYAHYERSPPLRGPSWLQERVAAEWLESPPSDVHFFTATRPPEDADLRYLLMLPSIEQIDLNCFNVVIGPNYFSQRGLRPPRFTDAGLKTLAQLPNLRRLIFRNENVTDKGIGYFSQSESLEALNIHDSDVSDVGLMQLAQIPTLQALGLRRTRVTAKGVADFVALRPDVYLYLDEEDWSLVPEESRLKL